MGRWDKEEVLFFEGEIGEVNMGGEIKGWEMGDMEGRVGVWERGCKGGGFKVVLDIGI